ncbi:STAS domain-containing protein [Intestinimonas massiliensis (ex Afouda et al. 2020)]|uniref:STAS domain-containing protein n=1 Tax=Intestinimonas massiliensis (ex Afouda et al. 2020) TaxID=1673721 RepID=UPI00102FAFC8|nr:STAS domain-containing protein [Intestinimonas massiliensis (ex Afouda et al. 2020)]
MAITCTGEGRTLYAVLDGELDHHRAREILAELDRQIDLELPRRLTLDLGGVSFMDSSGIAVLLRASRRMKELDGTLRVVHVPQQAAKVLRAAGLDKLMELE